MNAFIAFLALKMDLHSLMFGGALFQARVASFMNAEVAYTSLTAINALTFYHLGQLDLGYCRNRSRTIYISTTILPLNFLACLDPPCTFLVCFPKKN